MLKVGLTGGLACGKSTVSALFAELNVPVIDADIIARQVTAIGQIALQHIQQHFGTDVINQDGSLNRNALANIIFHNAEEKRVLETILHPLIYQQMQNQIQTLQSDYCILVIPLLFETQMQNWVHRVLVIDCAETLQLQRAQQRDAMNITTLQAIINSQVSRSYRQQHADDLIDNSADSLTLKQHVLQLHQFYLSLNNTGRFTS